MVETEASEETSQTMVSTLGAEGTSSRTLERAMTRAGAEMSAIRMEAPSLAKRMLASRPMPLGGVSGVRCQCEELERDVCRI